MPFYLRKSVSAGPFRFNFSNGGVGVSVGVKGFRVGTGPRGHYVHAGRGGIYYRASLGQAGDRRPTQQPRPSFEPHQLVFDTPGVEMREVESGDVLAMRDEAFGELIDEINAKQRQASMASLLGWGLAAFGVVVALGLGWEALWLALLGLPGWAIGKWMDSYGRTTVLFYDLDEDVARHYEALTRGFDGLAGCVGKWHVEAGGAVQDLTTWKRNAGATHIVRKKPTVLAYKLPAVIKSNVTPPAVHVGRQVIYFLPDVALIEDGARFGAVGYQDLTARWQDSNFIEEGSVPSDAQVVYYTWKHPNKSGGPDRRFNNNYQIPVCRYEVLHLTSPSGLNELVEFSKTGMSAAFAAGLQDMPRNTSMAQAQIASLAS